MTRRVFFSFHYEPDNWRAYQVRDVGVVEGNRPVSDNDWETITKGGDQAIKRWIAEQLDGKSCAVVLIGSFTARRKWITYEIGEAWDNGKGVVGMYVHNLMNASGNQSPKGLNPFDSLERDGKRLSRIVKAYDPPYTISTFVHEDIKENIQVWVDEAVSIRNNY